MKKFLRVLMVVVVITVASSIADASNGQIITSTAEYGPWQCVQTFVCTPSGWAPMSAPDWAPIV